MSAFRLAEVTCHLGYDCSGLSQAAHELEKSLEFKRAAEADFGRRFDVWRQGRSFTRPFVAPSRPATTVQPDAHGDVDPAQVRDFVREHLNAHVLGTTSVDVTEASTSTCVWDPIQQKWVTIGGMHVDLDGARLTADGAIDDFESAYRTQRASLPAHFDASLVELRAMSAVLFVAIPG